MKRSQSQRLLTFILIYTALSFYEPFWRLTMRAPMQGERFSWDYAGISGQGATGGYGIVVLFSIIGLIILTLGWRSPNRLFRWLVTIWALLLFVSSAAIVISEPGIVVTAETLGLEIPFAWLVFPFDTLYFVATFLWFLRSRQDWRQRRSLPSDRPKWTRTNTIFLVLAVLLVPLEYIFFNAGELHGTTDQVAVALTFIQYLLMNLSLVPWKQRTAKLTSRSAYK